MAERTRGWGVAGPPASRVCHRGTETINFGCFDLRPVTCLGEGGLASENRGSVGLEPLLAKFWQVRRFYRVSNSIPTNPRHNRDPWIAEAHLFF